MTSEPCSQLQTETERLRSMAADHSPTDHSPADHSPALQRLQQQVLSFSRQARQQDQLLRAQEETVTSSSCHPQHWSRAEVFLRKY